MFSEANSQYDYGKDQGCSSFYQIHKGHRYELKKKYLPHLFEVQGLNL